MCSLCDLVSGIQQLMSTLEKVSPMMKDREEDLSFVKRVVQSNDFQSLMHIHNVIKHGSVHTEDPVTKNSVAMSHIVSCNMTHYNSITNISQM